MLHPVAHARTTPDKAAYIMAESGEVVTYAQLDARANQAAHLLRARGVKRGDVVAILMDNDPRYFELVWAAERVGAYCTCPSSKLSAAEAAYIIGDSGCRVLFVSATLGELAAALVPLIGSVDRFAVGGRLTGFEDYEAARDAEPSIPIADPEPGSIMLYSSGTTGLPKGVRHTLPEGALGETVNLRVTLAQALWGWTPDMVYLSPAPLYHAAPLNWSLAVMNLGGTVIVMERFDPERALRHIEHYRATHAQWVPTHFIRMLKLPDETRNRYDLSSLVSVVHAAAPCPVKVKEAMIAWWGPIIHEYYAATEGHGFCAISSEAWLSHKGSVGKALVGEVKICDDDGEPLAPRQEGTIYFAGGHDFEYHNDPEKTAQARNRHGWASVGDVGWVDEEGYLYLTDRKSFMIISGGVNIYPQEIENLLIGHPKVADVAVIGAPHPEMGEEVVAVVQAANPADAGPALAAELTAFARENLSHVKTPRRIDFRRELPRHDTGKLYKRKLRDEYWEKESTT